MFVEKSTWLTQIRTQKVAFLLVLDDTELLTWLIGFDMTHAT